MSVFESAENPGQCLSFGDGGTNSTGTQLKFEECSSFLNNYTMSSNNINNYTTVTLKNNNSGNCIGINGTSANGNTSCSDNSSKLNVYEIDSSKNIDISELQLYIGTSYGILQPKKKQDNITQECKTYVDIYVGSSSSNTKTVTLPASNMHVIPKYINDHWAGDTFSVTVSGQTATVKRTNSSGGWGMDLILRACHKTSPGYRNLGCYKDGKDGEYDGRITRDVLNGSSYETWMKSGNNKLTTEKCYNFCKVKGTKYFGTQFGHRCTCGDFYGLYGSALDGNVKCDMKCKGSNEICGGMGTNNVYEITDDEDNRPTLLHMTSCTQCGLPVCSNHTKSDYKTLMGEYNGLMEQPSTYSTFLSEQHLKENGGPGNASDNGGCDILNSNTEFIKIDGTSPIYAVVENGGINSQMSDNLVFMLESPELISGNKDTFLSDDSTEVQCKIKVQDNTNNETLYLYVNDDGLVYVKQYDSTENSRFLFNISSSSVQQSNGITTKNYGNIKIFSQYANKYISVDSSNEITLSNSVYELESYIINDFTKYQFKFNYPISGDNERVNLISVKNPDLKVRYNNPVLQTYNTQPDTTLDNNPYLFNMQSTEGFTSNITEPLSMAVNTCSNYNINNCNGDINQDPNTLVNNLYTNFNSGTSIENTLTDIEDITCILNSQICNSGKTFNNSSELEEFKNILENIKSIKSNVENIYNEMSNSIQYINLSNCQGKGTPQDITNLEYNYSFVNQQLSIIEPKLKIIKNSNLSNVNVDNYKLDIDILYLLNDTFIFYQSNKKKLRKSSTIYDYLNIYDYQSRGICKNTNLFTVKTITNNGDVLQKTTYNSLIDEIKILINRSNNINENMNFVFNNYSFVDFFIHFFVQPTSTHVDENHYNNTVNMFTMKNTKTSYDNSITVISGKFGLMNYHSNYLYITRIFAYIYSFYEEIINYVNTKINNTDLTNFSNIHTNFYENFINTFKNKQNELKSSIGTITSVTDNTPQFPILSIINQIHSYTYSNQLKLCAFVNYLTENSGVYSDTITYEKTKIFTFLYQYYDINFFISYISNKIMTSLANNIGDSKTVCPQASASDAVVEQFTTREPYNNYQDENNTHPYSTNPTTSNSFFEILKYKDDENKEYENLSKLLESKYEMSDTKYMCNPLLEGESDINVPYDLSYSCMDNEYNTTGSLNDTNIGFNESCKIDTYDVSCGIYYVKLEYTQTNNIIDSVHLVIYDNNDSVLKKEN